MNHFFNAFRKYATFNERTTRREYWSFFFVSLGVSIFLQICLTLMTKMHLEVVGMPFSLVTMAYSFGSIVPGFAIAVRRAHDAGHRGWVMMVPIYGLYILLCDSVPGPNQWGPGPKNGGGNNDEANPMNLAA